MGDAAAPGSTGTVPRAARKREGAGSDARGGGRTGRPREGLGPGTRDAELPCASECPVCRAVRMKRCLDVIF